MADQKDVFARIAAKRRGEAIPDPEEEESGYWEPPEEEVELHRERGRRYAAERYSRTVDQREVVRVALQFFYDNGVDDAAEVFKGLQAVATAGGQPAVDATLAGLTEIYGEDWDEELGEFANAVNERAEYENQVAAQAEQQQRQEEIDALDRRMTEQHRRLLGDPALHASLEVLQSPAGSGTSPYETEDLDEREAAWRSLFALGKHKAEHEAVMRKKFEIMDSVRRLGGEDQSRPHEEARAETLWRLNYIDDDGNFAPDLTWDPTQATPVTKTQDEIRAEHDVRRWELREHLDHPTGFPHDHPLGEPLHTESDFAPEGEYGSDGD